ncbi:MAG: serine protease [Acidobacteriota bacterium]
MSTLHERLAAHVRAVADATDESLWHATSDEIRSAAEASAPDLVEAERSSAGGAAAFDAEFVPPSARRAPDPDEVAATASQGLEVLRGGGTPNDEQLVFAAAIVLRRERPAFDIVDGFFTDAVAPWQSLQQDEALLRPRIRAVGRVRADSAPYGHVAGTGFVVGPNLLMTNRHVAKYFVDGVGQSPGDTLTLDLDEEASCDLLAEIGRTEQRVLAFERVELVHPYWDVAVLRVIGEPLADITPLKLRATRPVDEEHVGDTVVVVGYPVEQYLRDRELRTIRQSVFGETFGVKRLMPGKLMARFEATTSKPGGGRRTVPALGHDATTLAGNSGSAVIDSTSGDVVGVHYKGKELDANFAVPSWEIARDTRFHDLGIDFTSGAIEAADPVVEAVWAEPRAQ